MQAQQRIWNQLFESVNFICGELSFRFIYTERKRLLFLWSLSLLNVNIKLGSLLTILEESRFPTNIKEPLDRLRLDNVYNCFVCGLY